MGKKQKLITQG